MSITNNEKLQLLSDLLKNQAAENYMTTDEGAQIERLLSSLSNDPSLDPNLQQTLKQIQLLQSNEPFQQTDVEQWINVISLS
ncbi:hypothetical protein GN156_04250 [bacterium LRH843]|nr:hypothetical protein [bacterium LRH843]